MKAPVAAGRAALLVSVEGRTCALPLECVVETMRPLPIEPLAGVPSFVRGVSVIRGMAIPVVDLGEILGLPSGARNRSVTIRVGQRHVALAVSGVAGIRELDDAFLETLPPLLGEAAPGVIEAIGTLDSRFLVVLRSGWELPAVVWSALERP